MDAPTLRRYADAVVVGGLGIGPGDTLAIEAQPLQREFVLALTEAAYRAGAGLVDLLVLDPRVQRARALLAPLETLDVEPAWQNARMRAILRAGAGILRISGAEDLNLMADVPAERAATAALANPGRGPYLRAVGKDDARFSIAAWATPAWAAAVFPDLHEAAAIEALERDILSFARVGPDDGDDAWLRHVERLESVSAMLEGRQVRRLRLRGPGTELEVALPEGTRWLGGRMLMRGRRVSPNIPTEEVFTSPQPGGTVGTFRCTRPLGFRGRLIDGIRGEFRGGRLVRLEADRDDDRDLLASHFATDAGAARLGEVALVDASSRVGSTHRTYHSTLFDENAASHIAFGQGFHMSRAPGAPRPNGSRIHLDVMIGGDDVDIISVDPSGVETSLLTDGKLA
jgi:aminopeptidase